MLICDLVMNPEFSLDIQFRIIGRRGDGSELTVYDTAESPDFPFDLCMPRIIGIRAGADGVMEILYRFDGI